MHHANVERGGNNERRFPSICIIYTRDCPMSIQFVTQKSHRDRFEYFAKNLICLPTVRTKTVVEHFDFYFNRNDRPPS